MGLLWEGVAADLGGKPAGDAYFARATVDWRALGDGLIVHVHCDAIAVRVARGGEELHNVARLRGGHLGEHRLVGRCGGGIA